MTNRTLIVTADPIAEAQRRIEALRPRTIALSGGETPRPLYERLAASGGLAWSEMDVFFGDERCVPPGHPDSNYRMAHEALLSKVSTRVHRMQGEACETAAAAYESEIRAVFGDGIPVFDLILLGIGEDGHTASLFPGAPTLDERERLVVAAEHPDHRRLTLTLPVLGAAHNVIFLITEPTKRDALRQLMNDGDVPAARVDAQSITIIAGEDVV